MKTNCKSRFPFKTLGVGKIKTKRLLLKERLLGACTFSDNTNTLIKSSNLRKIASFNFGHQIKRYGATRATDYKKQVFFLLNNIFLVCWC